MVAKKKPIKKSKKTAPVKPRKDVKTEENELNSLPASSKLELLREVSIIVAGKNTAPIVDLLFDKKNINEFIIAKKLGLTINQIRNMLYKLSDEGLVSFIRKKDKKKGWYTYFWTFDSEKAFILLKKIVLKNQDQLAHQLNSRESKQFYRCKVCNSELTEESALLHDFTCPECGEIYETHNNDKAIKEINSAIDKLKSRLKEIDVELGFIDIQKQKKAGRDLKKFEKEKALKRKESAKKRAATRKKNVKIKADEKAKVEKKKKDRAKLKKKKVAKKAKPKKLAKSKKNKK